MANVSVRHAEPDDYRALHRIFSGSRVIEDTLQLPLPSAEMWHKRISETPESIYALVACVEGGGWGPDPGDPTYGAVW